MNSSKAKTGIIASIIIVLLLLMAAAFFLFKDKLGSWYESLNQSYLETFEKPVETSPASNQNSNGTGTGSLIPLKEVPGKYNLKMEFHSQAPLLNWDAVHEELCEEASILLTMNYWKDQSMTDQEFDTELLNMKSKEEEILSVWKSTTVAEMQKFIEAYFPGYKVKIIQNITSQEIEQYIASGIPVLLPMSGQTIGNPFYKPPGPVYHVLVVKGFTATHFITNDVGTKRGKDFFYTKPTIMDNIHDWNPDNIANGAPTGFVILPK